MSNTITKIMYDITAKITENRVETEYGRYFEEEAPMLFAAIAAIAPPAEGRMTVKIGFGLVFVIR